MSNSVETRREGTTVVTKELKILFPAIFKPDPKYNRYGCTVLIPKTEKETLKALKEAFEQAKAEADLSDYRGFDPILKDGDESEHEGNHGFFILRPSNGEASVIGKPSAYKLNDEGTKMEKATEADMSSWFWGRVVIKLWVSKKKKTRSIQLHQVLITKAGDSYGCNIPPEESFGLPMDTGGFNDGFPTPPKEQTHGGQRAKSEETGDLF